MSESTAPRARFWNSWRMALWGDALSLWLLPALLMQLDAGVVWDESDFIIFAIMLGTAVGLCELAVRVSRSNAYLAGTGVAVAAGFLLTWANLAVGIIGNEENPANLMFFGVLAVGFLGALLARFRPLG